jgi:hypothetical protein
MTRKAKRTKFWKHSGGGCWVAGGKAGQCDDEYRHEKTGHRMTMRTTADRHFDMPSRVRGPAELRRLSGVSDVRVSKEDRPTRASRPKRRSRR